MDSLARDPLVIEAHVPLANLLGYAADLRAITAGCASLTMAFEAYAPVPPRRDDDPPPAVAAALRVP